MPHYARPRGLIQTLNRDHSIALAVRRLALNLIIIEAEVSEPNNEPDPAPDRGAPDPTEVASDEVNSFYLVPAGIIAVDASHPIPSMILR